MRCTVRLFSLAMLLCCAFTPASIVTASSCAIEIAPPYKTVVDANARLIHSAVAADIDEDGDLDLVGGMFLDDGVAWYNNTGMFRFDKIALPAAIDAAVSVFVADVDGTGTQDILVASYNGNYVAWFKNTNGLGTFLPSAFIIGTVGNPICVRAADLDGDARIDVLAASQSQNSVVWFRNNGSGFFPLGAQIVAPAVNRPISIETADLDADGAKDVLCASLYDNTLAWYCNMLNKSGLFDKRVISSTAAGASSIFAADLNGDGRLDVLGAAALDSLIVWFPNQGNGQFPVEIVLDYTADDASSVFAADLNGDSALDVIAGASVSNSISVYLNDGTGAFLAPKVLVSSNAISLRMVAAADLNQDGLNDIFSASAFDHTLAVFANDWNTSFATTYLLPGEGIISFAVADIDNDGDDDLVYGQDFPASSILLLRNIGGAGTFSDFPEGLATEVLAPAKNLLFADFDGDGDADLMALLRSDRLELYRNDDGFASLPAASRTIVDASLFPNSMFAADLNNDNAVDLVLADATSGISWLRNNGTGGFSSLMSISSIDLTVDIVLAADLTGDGIFDVISASLQTYLGCEIVSFIGNINSTNGGSLLSWLRTPVDILTPYSTQVGAFVASDVDLDGAVDLVIPIDSDIVLYRNSGGQGPILTWTKRILSGGVVSDARAIYAFSVADMDVDGAADIVFPSENYATFWLRNNGSGYFLEPRMTIYVTASLETRSVHASTDFNNDGLLDVLVLSSNTISYLRSVPSLGNAHPSPIMVMPPECASIDISTGACLIASVNAVASACFASELVLRANITGCFSAPFSPAHTAPLRIVGLGAVTMTCTTRARQSVLQVPGGSTISIENVHFAVRASHRGPTIDSGRSLLSVCSSSCRADDSASLKLVGVSVDGFANGGVFSLFAQDDAHGAVVVFAASRLSVSNSVFSNNSSPLGGGAIVLLGAKSSLSLTKSTFSFNRATGAFESELAGGGAIVVLGLDTSAVVADCLFLSNLAASAGGGAIAISGARAAISLIRVSFSGNRAVGGSGGTLVVRTSATDAFVLLRNCTMQRSWADGGAGGAIAVLGATRASVVLDGTSTISNCSANYGGALAALMASVATPAALDASAMALLPRGPLATIMIPEAATTHGSTILLNGSDVQVLDSLALFGGMAFSCGARIDMHLARVAGVHYATIAGGLAFYCSLDVDEQMPAPSASWLLLPTSIAAGASGTVASAGYGASLATPPVAIVLADFPASQMSGVALGAGTARLVDALGQTVQHRAIALRSVPAQPQGMAQQFYSSAPSFAEAELAVSGGTLLAVLGEDGQTYALAGLVLAVTNWANRTASTGIIERASLDIVIDQLASVPGSPVARVHINVTGCIAGWGRVSTSGALVCGQCLGESSTTAASAALGGICEACPANTYRSAPDGEGGGACLCMAGYYRSPTTLSSELCRVCPRGGICAGGLAAPVAAPGYFPDSSGTFVSCVNPKACLGGGTCAPGYTGRLCGKCASGWYALNGSCRRCARALSILVGIALTLLALGVASALIWFNLARSISHKFATVSIGLMTLQILALFGKLQLDWGPIPETIFRVASTMSLNVQLTSPECSLDPSIDAWQLRFWLTMALPMFAACALGLAALSLLGLSRVVPRGRLAGMSAPVLADAWRRSFFQSLTLMYMPLIAAALGVFGCRQDVAGVWVLVEDPSHRCFDARWHSRLLGPGLAFCFLYGAAIPCATVAVLWRARCALDSGEFHLRFSFAVARFRPTFWYFEAVLMGLKLALVLALTAFATDDGKASAGVIVLIGSLTHLMSVRPYARPVHHAVAVSCQLALSLTLLGGSLDDWLFRRCVASIGVLGTLAIIAIGFALDWIMYRREEALAAQSFRGRKADSFANAQANDVELDFAHDVRMRNAGGGTRLSASIHDRESFDKLPPPEAISSTYSLPGTPILLPDQAATP